MRSETLTVLAATDEGLVFVAIIAASVLVFFGIRSWRSVAETKEREQTKREIAAYVAEGTIRAEDAPKILGQQNQETEKTIADAVAWGTIKPEKAESLFRALRSGPSAASSDAKA
ncbi:MAG: hypothetical protein ACOYN0_04790 [Phycisphaerales bacterium]